MLIIVSKGSSPLLRFLSIIYKNITLGFEIILMFNDFRPFSSPPFLFLFASKVSLQGQVVLAFNNLCPLTLLPYCLLATSKLTLNLQVVSPDTNIFKISKPKNAKCKRKCPNMVSCYFIFRLKPCGDFNLPPPPLFYPF